MDELWRLTQTPDLHQRWDARFTDIRYLPRPDPAEPQRFSYATRIGFGRRVEGAGESVGEHDGPAGRTSALTFWSDDPKSLIREGSGYWKYVPTDDGIRFLTRYDYRTRCGVFGTVIDRLLFRPFLGWATAWSFDRLRLWIERGIDPATSMQRTIVHAIARLSLAFIWLYQGIVPKLLFRSVSGEIDTVRASGLFDGLEHEVLTVASAVEMALGVLMLLLWRARWMLALNVIALVILGGAAFVSDLQVFVRQFNPATLNAAMIALALIGWVCGRDLPSASACLRRPPENAA
jgi:hypothetical protein